MSSYRKHIAYTVIVGGKAIYMKLLYKGCVGHETYKCESYKIMKVVFRRIWFEGRRRRRLEGKGILTPDDDFQIYGIKEAQPWYRALWLLGVVVGHYSEKAYPYGE